MAERLALPTSDHGVSGSNPAEGEILSEPKRRFIAQNLSYSLLSSWNTSENDAKTADHPSIHLKSRDGYEYSWVGARQNQHNDMRDQRIILPALASMKSGPSILGYP